MKTSRRAVYFGIIAMLSHVMSCSSDTTTEQIQAIVTSLQVNLGLTNLTVGQTVRATATAHNAVGGALAGVTITWNSSNPGVASVTPDGLVTAVAPGSADIIASAAGRLAAASVSVIGTPAVVTVASVGVTLTPSVARLGRPVKAAAVVRDSNGAVLTNRHVTWAASNISIATITQDGTVTPVSPGTTDITAACEGVTGSASFTVESEVETPGLPVQLTTSVQPTFIMSGDVLVPSPVVVVRDGAGLVVPTATNAVTATISSGAGTLAGSTTVAAVNGVATFSNLRLTGAGVHVLAFSSPGLASATSVGFGVAARATRLSMTTQPSSSGTSGTSFTQQPVIQLRDAGDNAANQAGVVVTASVASGGGALGGTLAVTTSASGVATFTNLSIAGADGARTLRFASAGLTSVTSSPISVTAQVDGEPVFNPAVNMMVYQDDMNAYNSAVEMGAAPAGPAPRIAPIPSPIATSQPVTTNNQVISPGRGGSGKALRLAYPAVTAPEQSSATWWMTNAPATPSLATHYFQYYARITINGTLNNPLAVKWFQAWHRSGDGRIQWNTHDHLPCPVSGQSTYWQVYDQSRMTNCQGNQPVGPYFTDLVNDGEWHRFTYLYRPNSAAGARDGQARMWIDGVKIIDVSSASIGVTPPGGSKPWCDARDVDNLAVLDGIGAELRWGSVQTTTSPGWFYDIDDFRWWRQ